MPIDTDVFTTQTVRGLRSVIDAHDLGQFSESARLAGWCLRDADLVGALLQRVRRLLAWPLCVLDADGSELAREYAAQVRRRWSRVCSRQAAQQLVVDAVLLGFGAAQVVWAWDEELGEVIPTVQPWPAHAVAWDPLVRQWSAQTRDGISVPIVPGDGRWVIYTPSAAYHPWLWGAIRSVAVWCLRSEFTSRDASRLSEIHGVPVWLARMPAGARETAEGQAYLRSLRNMGRNAVVPLPKGTDEASHYELKLEQPQTDTYRIFDWMSRSAAGRMRLAILGQDLTSQNAETGARATSQTGRDVTNDVVESDAETLADCLHDQVLVPWGAFRGLAGLEPRVVHREEREPDRVRRAQALLTHGQAMAAWGAAGAVIDIAVEAERAGLAITGVKEPAPVTAPPPPAPTSP